MQKLFLSLLALLFLTSCGEERVVKKFVLRFNAGYYSKASKYLSPASKEDYARFCSKYCYDPYQPQINILANKKIKKADQINFKFTFSNAPEELISNYGQIIETPLHLTKISNKKYIDFPFKENSSKTIYGTCNVQSLNIREAPSTESQIIGKLSLFDKFEIVDTIRNGWIEGKFQINEMSSRGYVSKAFVILSPDQVSFDDLYLELKWYEKIGILGLCLIGIVLLIVLLAGSIMPFVAGPSGCLISLGILILSALFMYVIFDLIGELLFELLLIQL